MKRAFVLIELLAVIAIIGVLIALLLPAVQSAREAVRRNSCANNLMQFGVAARHYEQNFGVLPSGTVNETGPIRNVPLGNHIGWIPRLLPFIEQNALYSQIDFSKGVYDPENRDVWLERLPSRLLNCPSDGNWNYRGESWNSDTPTGPAMTNYMACHSSTETPIDTDNDGVFFLNSKLRSRDIPDGTSNTIFFGEASILFDNQIQQDSPHYGRKYILPEGATGPFVYGSLGWMSGTPGTLRNTGNPPNVYVGPFANWPMPHQILAQVPAGGAPAGEAFDPETWKNELPGQYHVGGFGSYHPMVTNFILGDGSIRAISSSIDSEVYQKLGRRGN